MARLMKGIFTAVDKLAGESFMKGRMYIDVSSETDIASNYIHNNFYFPPNWMCKSIGLYKEEKSIKNWDFKRYISYPTDCEFDVEGIGMVKGGSLDKIVKEDTRGAPCERRYIDLITFSCDDVESALNGFPFDKIFAEYILIDLEKSEDKTSVCDFMTSKGYIDNGDGMFTPSYYVRSMFQKRQREKPIR